jgi:transcriptional regulator with GAF, ATPase, and Fis domain
MRLLLSYPWPGNVRELQNVIERAVILSGGGVIQREHVHVEPLREPSPPMAASLAPLQVVEREHILRTLEHTNWKVSGKGGAAELLGLKPTTLEARMKKLGIKRAKS